MGISCLKLIIWGSKFFSFPDQGSCLGAQTHMGSSRLAPLTAWLWTADRHSHQLCTSNTHPSGPPCLLAPPRPSGACPGPLWAPPLPLLSFHPRVVRASQSTQTLTWSDSWAWWVGTSAWTGPCEMSTRNPEVRLQESPHLSLSFLRPGVRSERLPRRRTQQPLGPCLVRRKEVASRVKVMGAGSLCLFPRHHSQCCSD